MGQIHGGFFTAMSISDWMPGIAFGIAIAFAGGALGALPPPEEQPLLDREREHEQRQTEPVGKTAGERQPKSESAPARTRAPNSADERQHSRAKDWDGGAENGPVRRFWLGLVPITDDHDSLAQWLMALFGIVATFASVYAVWLLRLTLIASREAATYTGEMLNLEREANARAEASFIKLERPYVYAHGVTQIMPHDEIGPHIEFTISNLGKMPATILEVRGGIEARRIAGGFQPLTLLPHDDPDLPVHVLPDIASGDSRSRTIVYVPTNIQIGCEEGICFPENLPHAERLFLRVSVLYEGPFSGKGAPHETTECWRFEPRTRRFVVCAPHKYRKRT